MSYTPHAYRILEATTGYFNALDAAEDIQGQLSELKNMRNKQLLTEKGYQQQSAPLKAELNRIKQEARSAAVEKIHTVKNEYHAALDKWSEPSAEKLHPDLQLLNGQIPLSTEQLESLGRKHSTNPLMASAIKRYSDEHNVPASLFAPTVDMKRETFDDLCSNAIKATSDSGFLHRAVYGDQDSFERFALSSAQALTDSGE